MAEINNEAPQEWFDSQAEYLLNDASALTAQDVLWRIQQTAKRMLLLVIDRHSETAVLYATSNRRGQTNPFTMDQPDSWGSNRRT